MTQIAGCGDMCASQWESGRAVVKSRAQPRSCGVARRASRRITSSDMVRDGAAKSGGALIILCMAAVAIRGQRAAVIAVHVAQGASNSSVCASQWESSRAVIKRRCGPVGSRMANRAVGREASRDVIRNRSAQCCRAVPIRGVASVASRSVKRVVIAHVARCAWRRRRRNVHSGKRKPRRAVVESGCRPTHRCVARGAVGRGECCAGSGMRRSIRVLPVRQVAAGSSASCGCNIQRVVAIDVTQRARNSGVGIRQRETGRGVVEHAGSPSRNRVAGSALRGSRWESSGNVIWNAAANRCGALERGGVASVAVGGAQ
jgi:hypothetical protein